MSRAVRRVGAPIAGVCAMCAFGRALAATPKKKLRGVLVYDTVLTSDVTAPLEVFGDAVKQKQLSDYDVVAIGPDRKPITTQEGLVLMPEYSADDAPQMDVLIVGSSYESPRTPHIVSRNASTTEPATLLVLLISDKDESLVVPIK